MMSRADAAKIARCMCMFEAEDTATDDTSEYDDWHVGRSFGEHQEEKGLVRG